MTVSDLKRLTTRHIEILTLMADGKSRKEIAYLTGLGKGTVGGYIKSAMDITGAHNATGLIGLAFRKGWIS